MRLKQRVTGIVLAFLTVGVVVTAEYESGYQHLYDTHKKQETTIKKALSSEFISLEDQQLLENDLSTFEEAKNSANKESLREIMSKEQKNIVKVEQNLLESEGEIAKEELVILTKEVEELEKKTKEPFILSADAKEVETLKKHTLRLTNVKQVEPIRELTQDLDELTAQMTTNQTKTIEVVDDLKGINKETKELVKHKYLLVSDKKILEEEQKDNASFFKNADDFKIVESRLLTSKKALESIKTKVENTEKDFQEFEQPIKELIKSANDLLNKGKLTKEEIADLKTQIKVINEALGFKNYQPGDLSEHQNSLKANYDKIKENSDKKIAEAKKKAEQEAKERAKKEEAARLKAEKEAAEQAKRDEITRQQAEAEAQRQAEAANNNQEPGSLSLVGDWYQAPPGYKFLKVESGLTYGQVKNPDNFSLISASEAANYRAGHGNGSAKQ